MCPSCGHAHNRILYNKKKEQSTDKGSCTSQLMQVKEPNAFTWHSRKYKIIGMLNRSWLPKAWDGGRGWLHRVQGNYWGKGTVLYFDHGDGYIANSMYLSKLTKLYTTKVNFTLYSFKNKYVQQWMRIMEWFLFPEDEIIWCFLFA
jgi:hypothetical protein